MRALKQVLVASLALTLAFLLVLADPAPAEAQGERPSIRISGGHIYIGGWHSGSIGIGRDPHAMGRLIRHRLSGIGDGRAVHFGPGRRADRSGLSRFPRWIHPRTRSADRFGPRDRRMHSGFRHGGFRHDGRSPFWPHRHVPKTGLVVVIAHPLGAVILAQHVSWWRWSGVSGVAVRPGLGVDPAWTAAERGGEPADPPAAVRRPPPAVPPPVDRCADVTVRLIAGAVHTVRIDLESLGVASVEEAEKSLQAKLRAGARLELPGAMGGGLLVPASLVRTLRVAACDAEGTSP